MPRPVLCPYCGTTSHDTAKCSGCGGLFDPLSRQATQNAMGPWFIRDQAGPFRPGCSFDTLRGMISRGKVTPDTIIRGPSTRQFWELARRAPGIANLLGLCHNCQEAVEPADFSCRACGTAFNSEQDRQHLGVGPIRLLPGQASPERIAAASLPAHAVDVGAPTSALPAETPAPTPVPGGPSRSRNARSVVFLVAVGAIAIGAAAVAVWRLSEQGVSPVSLVDKAPQNRPKVEPLPIPEPEPAVQIAEVEPTVQVQRSGPAVSAPETPASAASQAEVPSAAWGRLERLRGLR